MNIYFLQMQSDIIYVFIGILFAVELFLLIHCVFIKNLDLNFV